MCRINTKNLRIPKDRKDFWVVKGGTDDIRPYKLLIQEVKNDKKTMMIIKYIIILIFELFLNKSFKIIF